MATILDLFGRRGKAEARMIAGVDRLQREGITQVNFFPLGGIMKTAGFANKFGAAGPMSRAASA